MLPFLHTLVPHQSPLNPLNTHQTSPEMNYSQSLSEPAAAAKPAPSCGYPTSVVTLNLLDGLGCELRGNGEYEEAIEIFTRCLEGRTKVLEEDHMDALMSLTNLGNVYANLGIPLIPMIPMIYRFVL